jgi:hypothetical protein
MPLRITQEESTLVPLIFCDHCGEVIAADAEGNCEYPLDRPGDFTGVPVYFTHKQCTIAFRQANPGPWYWMPICHLLVCLANNLKIDWKKARLSAKSWCGY